MKTPFLTEQQLLQKDFIFTPNTIGSLMKGIKEHKVDRIYFSKDMKTIYSQYKKAETGEFSVAASDPSILKPLLDSSVYNRVDAVILRESYNPYSDVINTLSSGFYALYIPILLFLIVRSLFSGLGAGGGGGGGGLGDIGLKTPKLLLERPAVALTDWVGSPEVLYECTEVISYIKNRTAYEAAGAELPKGILLEGPPGTGKTLVAKAIATEAAANFISVSASEFVEIFVGAGSSKVRALFDTARKNRPCIIFIDEIDAVGKKRNQAGGLGGNDEREQTLNQILFEMDGFASNTGIMIIAATNRKDVLDEALLRPGRFDRIINIPLPDLPSRQSLFELYLKNKKTALGVNSLFLAEMTAGFSGAKIKNVANEAAIFAAREGRQTLTESDLERVLEKLAVGILKDKETRSPAVIRRVAIHEVGHALLAAFYSDIFDLKKVSIQNNYNGMGGFTFFQEKQETVDAGLYTKDHLKKRLVVAMGGKAAETVFYGTENVSLGANQDLKEANQLARKMIQQFGMGEDKLETFYTDPGALNKQYGEKTQEAIDLNAAYLVDEAFQMAVATIENHKPAFMTIVHRLMEERTLDGRQVQLMIF